MELPQWLTNAFRINFIEFLANIVGIWISLLESSCPFPKLLSLSDNTSTVGWLYKSSFTRKDQDPHDVLARQLARLLFSKDASVYEQHIPGQSNLIADSLSRDTHLPTDQHVFALKTLFPHQVPENFHIRSIIPTEITSWITSLKPIAINRRVSPPARNRSTLGALLDGKSSYDDATSMITFWMDSIKENKFKSSALLRQLSDEMILDPPNLPHLLAQRLNPPLTTFVRSFDRTFARVPS